MRLSDTSTMRKLTPLFILGTVLPFCVLTVKAQEGLEIIAPRELREHRTEIPSPGSGNSETEVDVKSFKPAAREIVRDSVQHTRPAPSRKAEKQPSEDVLKFNFLYYIIQRFKFSDIIE